MRITMCTSLHCSERGRCYRATENLSEYQNCSNFEYTCNENSGFCDFIAKNQNTNSQNP